MTNDGKPENSWLSIAQLESELWEKKLHDPVVYDKLVKNRESLRLMTVADVLLIICILAFTAWLSVEVHWLMALVGAVVLLVFWGKKRLNLVRAQREIDFLIGDPSEIFNSIAVNKIMMEACDRSAEVGRYLRAVNHQGRYRITAFENDVMVRILGALDRHEREMRENDKCQ